MLGFTLCVRTLELRSGFLILVLFLSLHRIFGHDDDIMKTYTIVSLLVCIAGVSALNPRADIGDPCVRDNNCYGGAKCCNRVCKLGDCTGLGNNAGAKCALDANCYGGAICCLGICTLGSCRMDGTCDADNDCYGWCHNNVSGVVGFLESIVLIGSVAGDMLHSMGQAGRKVQLYGEEVLRMKKEDSKRGRGRKVIGGSTMMMICPVRDISILCILLELGIGFASTDDAKRVIPGRNMLLVVIL